MSGREDLNLRLLGPEPSALNQAELRPEYAASRITIVQNRKINSRSLP